MKKKALNTKKLSVAATQALEDLEACEKDPRYHVNMGIYHLPENDSPGVCSVCFAGSVMAKRLGSDPELPAHTHDFDGKTETMLDAIDGMRCGWLASNFVPHEVAEELYKTKSKWQLRSLGGRESYTRHKWKSAMRRMIKMLERRGL